MGRLVIQRILKCHECGKTPDDGEKLWEMPEGFICEPCSEKEEEPDRECYYCGQESCDCDML